MTTLQSLIDQIPIRHDFSSHVVLIGIIQGFFLSLIIFKRSNSQNKANIIFGWTVFAISLVILDNYLCYTGLIKYVLNANDSTEPIVLLISPLLYFFLYTLLERRPLNIKKHWVHFIPAILYAISQIGYYLHPLSVKYNAYIGAYHSHLEYAETPASLNYGYHWVKDEFRWLVLASFIVYTVLGLRLIIKNKNSSRALRTSFKTTKQDFGRNTVIFMALAFVVALAVFWNFEDDGGDHFIGFLNTIVMFSTSFVLLSESRFFENSWIADKYETLGAKNTDLNLVDIRHALVENEFYLSNNASIGGLAKLLNTSTNHVSRIINSELNINFNEFINQYRVKVAKKRLLNPEFANYTVEAIGHSVGFRSKSTFYNAFKKETHISPTEFIKREKRQNSS